MLGLRAAHEGFGSGASGGSQRPKMRTVNGTLDRFAAVDELITPPAAAGSWPLRLRIR